MRISEILTEGWSQKYKSSINCSHPKGFSQKAHCAGKKTHNESIEMELVCEDCGMCEAHGNSKIYDKCWTGFRKVPGKTRGEKGSCEKIGEDIDADQKRVGQVSGKEKAKKIGTVLGTSPKQHPFKGRLVGEDTVKEVAPPGMEDWIKDRKADFKKRYGDRWQEVLYATAWKQHNK